MAGGRGALDSDHQMNMEDENYHVYPTVGREHLFNDKCWCMPERDLEQKTVIIHNIEQ